MARAKGDTDAPLMERVWRSVDVRGEDECWPWTRGTHLGYGVIKDGPKVKRVHRVIAASVYGETALVGLVVDHRCHTTDCQEVLCEHRRCCNPSHLQVITQRENIARGNSTVARQMVATHCSKGHLLDDENTYLYRGGRRCKKCRRVSCRDDHDRHRDERNRRRRERTPSTST